MALASDRQAAQDGGMPTRDVHALLGTTWFAADLSPAARARLAALGTLAQIGEGATVVREGEACDSLGVVISGRIALRLRLPGGRDRTILTVDPGDVYGWSAVLPPAIATSTGVAVLPTRAVLFDGQALRSALAKDCDLAAAIYGRLLVSVARRLVATRVQLLDLYSPGYEPW
jgi:CRP/FNR family cyclic AMP-dependent transcriptional regulator